MLIACTTFTACNSDESSLPTAGNQLQLSFGIHAPQSRAIFTDTKLPDGKPVGVRLDGYADYANLVYTGTTTSGTQSWASTTSVTLTDTKGTLYAYWPQSSSVEIDAIDVDMTVADQTDWLYATPVADVNKNKASVAVTMNHAAANINVTVNKGSYLGAGNITNITLQSDGIALGGTFNATQTTPGYTAFEDEGKPLSRTVSTTAGGTATDIMVVPSGKSATITFLLTIDGIQFTAKSDAIQLAMGNSYQYTLNLSDISTYMEISGFSVKPWTTVTGGALVLEKVGGDEPLTWDNAPNGVYAVSAEGLPVTVEDADESCIAVALIVNDAPVPQAFWIEKYENEGPYDIYQRVLDSYYESLSNPQTKNYDGLIYYPYHIRNTEHDFEYDDYGFNDYLTIDGNSSLGYFPLTDGTYTSSPYISTDYIGWMNGALSDFNGKQYNKMIKNLTKNTTQIANISGTPVGLLYNAFVGQDNTDNLGYTDWYIPALGQLGLMYLNASKLNEILVKIGGKKIRAASGTQNTIWSSTNMDGSSRYIIDFDGGEIQTNINNYYRVRFIRNAKKVSFSVDSEVFQMTEGMTWCEFVDSKGGNLFQYIDDYDIILNPEGNILVGCKGNDIIIQNRTYNTVNTIKFSIPGKECYAEEGMTWKEFCDSDMNLVNSLGVKYFSCSTTNVLFCTDAGMSFNIKFNDSFVRPTDLIVADANYTYYTGGGGGQ